MPPYSHDTIVMFTNQLLPLHSPCNVDAVVANEETQANTCGATDPSIVASCMEIEGIILKAP